MSATIDPVPYVKYFGEDKTHAVYIDGHGHSLFVRSIKEPITDYVMQAALACVQVRNSPVTLIGGSRESVK